MSPEKLMLSCLLHVPTIFDLIHVIRAIPTIDMKITSSSLQQSVSTEIGTRTADHDQPRIVPIEKCRSTGVKRVPDKAHSNVPRSCPNETYLRNNQNETEKSDRCLLSEATYKHVLHNGHDQVCLKSLSHFQRTASNSCPHARQWLSHSPRNRFS